MDITENVANEFSSIAQSCSTTPPELGTTRCKIVGPNGVHWRGVALYLLLNVSAYGTFMQF